MNHRKRKILLSSLVILLVLMITGIVIYFSSLQRTMKFLTMHRPVDADFLVVEGWVEESVLSKAVDEFESGDYSYIITTGSQIEPYYLMSTEGLLEYRLHEHPVQLNPGDTLDVCVKGTPVHGVYPKFTLFLNGNKTAQQSATQDWNYYSFVFDSAIVIHQLGITFDNDEVYFEQDRNLYVRSVELKGISYPARSAYASYYAKSDRYKQNPVATDFHSLASICAEKLRQMGVPEDKIITLESPQSDQNRTLISALVVNDWIVSNDLKEISVNILSESIHSRRTYMLYRYALRQNSKRTGIISVMPEDNRYLGNQITKEIIIRELAGNLYYRFLFNKRKFKRKFHDSE